MKFNNVKKNLLMSIIVFIVMMILLILLSSGISSPFKTMLITIILAASVIIVGIIWANYYKQMKNIITTNEQEVASGVSESIGHTGLVCEISGLYQCVEHDYRKVNMKKGRRFPPCKGEDKSHSTDWRLIRKSTN